LSRNRNGVLCLEREWDSDMGKMSSVEPLLQLIKNERGHPYVFRDVATPEELCFLP